MTDKEDRDIREVNIESNDIGTEGGKSWDHCFRITLRSSDPKEDIAYLIKEVNVLIKDREKQKK